MFSKLFLAGTFAAYALAQQVSPLLFFTRVPNPVTAGEPTALTYSTNDTSSPVSIILRKGLATDLQIIATLTDSATDGQFIWTPSTDLENASDYALEISQAGLVNYFGPFTIQGAGGAASSASSSPTASSPPTASASSTASPAFTASSLSSPPASVTFTGSLSSSSSITPIANMTMTTTPLPSTGTTTFMTRNGTMTRPTLTSPSIDPSIIGPANTDSSPDLQTTSAPAQSTGAASTLTTGGSALALAFGALAAVLFC